MIWNPFKKKKAELPGGDEDDEDDDWEYWWDGRMAAMSSAFGESDDRVLSSLIPMHLGGNASVVKFHHYCDGILYVTSDLISPDLQPPSELGIYELAICQRDDEWGPGFISKLASYTLETPLAPGDTMEISSATPEGSTISALLFTDIARFEVHNQPCGVLLCIGITDAELAFKQASGSAILLEKLKEAAVFPLTDLQRDSVV